MCAMQVGSEHAHGLAPAEMPKLSKRDRSSQRKGNSKEGTVNPVAGVNSQDTEIQGIRIL